MTLGIFRASRKEYMADGITEIISGYETPFEAYRSKQYKQLLQEEHYNWLSSAKDWKSMITLTFDDRWKKEIYTDVAKNAFRSLVRYLNQDLFGKRYVKLVGHSYFSYILGLEYQKREVVHFHVLVDQYVDFEAIHKYWNHNNGFAWIKPCRDVQGALEYITKYVCKSGDANLEIFFNPRIRIPNPKPFWYAQAESRVAGDLPATCEALDAAFGVLQ